MNALPPRQGPVPPGAVPLLGQREAQAKAGIMQAVGQLSLQIYVQLATRHTHSCTDICHTSSHQESDRKQFQQLARDSQLAAKAYFEGLGIAQFEEAPSQPDAQ